MNTKDIEQPGAESSLDRRSFLINASTSAGALILGFNLPLGSRASMAAAAGAEAEVHAYVRIGADGSVTITYGGSSIIWGSLIGHDWIIISGGPPNKGTARSAGDIVECNTVEQANFTGAGTRYLGRAVTYLTAGSGAVRRQHDQLRNAGAAAREMLVAAGATRMGVLDFSECWAEDGVVYGPSGSVGYGDIAADAAALPVPTKPKWTDPADYQIIGKSLPRKDIPLKVNGRAKYGIDVRLTGMVYASVKHCPVFGGTMKTLPRKPSGAIAIVPLAAPESRGATKAGDINAVAVVTNSNTWKAMQAAKGLRVSWNIPPESADMDDVEILYQAEELMYFGEAFPAEDPVGDVDEALANAAAMIDSTYYLPYISHVCMEVLNCTVDYRGDSCEIWCPVQAANWVLSEAVALTGLPSDKVTVHVTFLGGGLGRKIERDYYSQAIQVGIAIKKPVKLTWTREDDTRFDQYRPMALINVKAGLDDQGGVAAWQYRHVSPSISRQRGRSLNVADGQATEGQYGLPYAFANSRSEWVEHTSKVPVGYWRSVGHSLNSFAVESAIDELAEAAGKDPMDFRKELMASHPRALNVVEVADVASEWRHSLPSGRAWGMAFSEAFGSLVCQVVEISGSATSIRVHDVVCAVDCGTAINPGSVEMQMQSGIIHGLNAALWGGQSFVNGEPQVANFNKIRMLRVKDAPNVDVRIIASGEPLGGIGEPGVPPIAPAVANAYYQLTGIRVRSLPFFPITGGAGETSTGGGGGSTSIGATIEFQGSITSVGSDSLIVSGKTIIITSSTKIEVSGGKFKVGQKAQGMGQQQSSGDIIASKISAE